MPDNLPNPALMLEARDAAYAEVYAIDRKRFSDEEWRRVEPVLLLAMDAQRRQIMIRYDQRFSQASGDGDSRRLKLESGEGSLWGYEER